MKVQNNQFEQKQKMNKRVLDKRLESIGWALFFIMIGVLLIVPEGFFPEGTWLLGTAIVILGFEGIRYLLKIKINVFWIGIGGLFLIFGIDELYALDLPIIPIFIILFGISLLLKPPKEKDWFDCGAMMEKMWGDKTQQSESK